MAAPLGFSEQTVGELCETIAAETSAPGGGSVAAVAGAFAASLVAMAARFSIEQWEDAAGAVAQAETLRTRLLPLADEDAHAYENFLLARRMPQDVEPEVRDAAIGEALSRAADVPLAIAEAALDVASLAADLAERGNPNLRGDAATAALLAEAAVRATANLVEINLSTRDGDERIARARELVETTRRISRRVIEPEPELRGLIKTATAVPRRGVARLQTLLPVRMRFLARGTGAGARAVGSLDMAPGAAREDPVGLLSPADHAAEIKPRHELVIQRLAAYPQGPMNGPFLSVDTMMMTMIAQTIEAISITGVTSR
jgi:methenyltetrahydrofolate cyclohydrolase